MSISGSFRPPWISNWAEPELKLQCKAQTLRNMSPCGFAAAPPPCCSTEGNSWAEAAKANTKFIFTSYTYNMPIYHLLEKCFLLNTDTDTCGPLYRVCVASWKLVFFLLKQKRSSLERCKPNQMHCAKYRWTTGTRDAKPSYACVCCKHYGVLLPSFCWRLRGTFSACVKWCCSIKMH